ncbi:zinc transporter ZntB [uncultured Sphingomonas sp.]|uniref:zinc transporter ZntB n=1 Tax=uncultured Sphingomonas sp. TaxID=158754 RepID=UPI0025CD03E6|nr:zinc transporter ZntB [uncultured Sphingomonas sp.]
MKGWAYQLAGDGRGQSLEPAAACASAPQQAAFVWVHLDGREEDTLDWLKQHGGMPDTVAHSLTAIETRPRCEPIADGALINLRGPAAADDDSGDDRLVSIRAWVEAGRAVSVSLHALGGLDYLREQMEKGAIRDPGDLISQLGIVITRQVDPVITDLGDEIDDCETQFDPDRVFETRRRIATARSDAIVYRRFVAPQREALSRLADLAAPWLDDDDRLHLREAADRFARMAEELEAVRERAALIHEQLTDLRSEQIERRALLLSIVALIFLPLTFLTGLLGMNVEGIPFAHEPWAFGAVCGLSVLIAGGITWWFAAERWFRR